MLAAGANQKPGESRLDLLTRNAEIFAEIVPAVLAAAPDTIFLVASNPVDIITRIVTALASRHGVAPERVIGSGTIFDSARFRTLLAAHLGISPAYIDARVLGEHGDSGVLHWSGAVAGDLPVAEAARQMGHELTEADRSRIDTAVRRAADDIIKGKGATWFGVGAGLARMAQVIQGDERALLTCSMLTAECHGIRDVALSLPRVLGAGGVVTTFMPHLDAGERAALKRSAEILKEAAKGLRFNIARSAVQTHEHVLDRGQSVHLNSTPSARPATSSSICGRRAHGVRGSGAPRSIRVKCALTFGSDPLPLA